MRCLSSCRVADHWVRDPMYQLSVFWKPNNNLDFHNVAAYALQLPVPRVQRDSVHLTIMRALRTHQMILSPGLLAHSPAYSPQKLRLTGSSHSNRAKIRMAPNQNLHQSYDLKLEETSGKCKCINLPFSPALFRDSSQIQNCFGTIRQAFHS